MAIKIGANFAYNGKLPNFERDKFETKAAMKAFDENNIDEGHLSYCEEDGNIYQYKSANTVDATTGRWRIFKTEADATLNGTSTNPIQNKAVFEALKSKADVVALAAYQPKYDADYIATSDLSILPITTGIIDLNGYQINLPNVIATDGYLTIRNGIVVFDTTITKIEISGLTFEKATVSCSDDVSVTLNIQVLECHDVLGLKGLRCNFIGGNSTIRSAAMFNSFIDFALPIAQNLNVYNSTCYINGNVKLTAYNSFVGDEGLSLANGSAWDNTQLDIFPHYNSGWVDEAGKMYCDMYFDDTITGDSDYAPQTKAVYNALQLKADKTQLNDLATKTELNGKADASALNNYVTTATANTTYAKKSDISNVYKFKGTKTNYADLPTTNRVTGDVWNIINADAEHGIKAGDNVAWNGTAWDNLSGTVDLSAYATTATTDAMSADITSLMNEVFVLTTTASVSPNIAEVGTNPTVALTVDAKLGKGRTQVDEITIDGTKYTGTIPYTHSATATTTHTYNITVKKGAKTADASATINFYNASYYGVVDASKTSLTATEVKTLKTKEVKSGRSGTRTFNLTNQKACIAYPQSFGAAASIKDANGFDYLASYTRSEVTIDSVVYYVYLLSSPTTITDFKQIID